jgi:hypothetical protein
MESSLDNFFSNFTEKNEVSKYSDWNICDFNNVETADRKLIINKKYQFWVHDDVLNYYCDYFVEFIILNNDDEYNQIEVNIPYEYLILDVLHWMYSKDSKKILKVAKNFKNFVYLLSLGSFLKMKNEFYEILLNQPLFEWKIQYFTDIIWSRNLFNYSILERIINQMNVSNYFKIYCNQY